MEELSELKTKLEKYTGQQKIMTFKEKQAEKKKLK